MKKISIVGQITDSKFDGCFSPFDLKEQLEGVDQNEPLEVEITSEGGSVFAGIQIANILSRHNGKVTTHAVGLCASIATVILMAGDKVVVDSNCFCLIHLPWTYCEGNAKDMEKEIDTLKKCEAAMIGYYKKHSKVGDDVLSKYIEDETWFLGTEFADVFDCEVLECDQHLNIAARFDLTKFNKIDKRISEMNKQEIEEEKIEETTSEETKVEEVVEPAEEVEEEKKENEPVEEVVETKDEDEETTTPFEQDNEDDTTNEPSEKDEVLNKNEVLAKFAEYEKQIEELKNENEELKKRLEESEKPVEDRLSGLQSSLQKNFNAQIKDLNIEIEAKTKELIDAKSSIISLKSELECKEEELSKTISALQEKSIALDSLNSAVNAPCETLPTMNDGLAKCATPAEKVAFLKAGKFVR